MHDLKKAEETLLVAILLAAFGFWAWRRYKFRRKFKWVGRASHWRLR